jgi:RNA polymerase sigma factor for flagellar operon FliA
MERDEGARMHRQPLVACQRERIAAGLPFVESLARRVASSMPHSIELGDLVQDGMLGLIDAAFRFDEARGIKFETFAERRVRGAMIDALRRDAWPRGVRRQRRELEAAREELRRELGAEPSLADLAARVGSDETRLGRTIVRINTIESTSPLSAGENVDGATLPAALVPSEPPSPDRAYEEIEVRDRVRAAIASLPPRERKVIGLYYYGDATMKQIGAEIGVNESRVSQLHARAIQRLRKALGADCSAEEAARALRPAVIAFQQSQRAMEARLAATNAKMARAAMGDPARTDVPAVVLPYKKAVKPASRRRPSPAARVAIAR